MATLAARQHGVVSIRQLRALGLSDQMITGRVAVGALHRVFRGVYAVGHPGIGRHGVMYAALLACGEGAVISHGSAAELLGLWDRGPNLVDVTGIGQRGRKIQGIRWHRVRAPEPDEALIRNGIRCTSPSRTLVDIAGSCGDRSLRRMIEQAAVLGVLDVDGVDRVVARGRRRGATRLRAILVPWRGEKPSQLRSRTEARLLAAVVDAGLPRPRSNVLLQIDGHRLEVDLLWQAQRLVVETDGEQTHGTRVAFRRDRWRDQVLAAAGYRTVRVTWSQLEDEGAAILARLGSMLGKQPFR